MEQNRIAVWREALLLPGETDLVESGLRELTEYFGITREEALRQCEDALAESKREWESSSRQTAEQIKDFYRSTRSYIFEHIWWHATDVETNSANVEILNYAQNRRAGEYLDFGSGVGSNAILFASRGFNVTLADISPPMMEFARWRLQRRRINTELIDLNRRSLPAGRFDFVTAVDVCEHLPCPEEELKQISQAMKDGGALIFNYRAGEDVERPMHILKTTHPILRALRSCGLRTVETDTEQLRRLEFHTVEKLSQSKLKGHWFNAYDRLRYSQFFTPGQQTANGHRPPHPQRIYFERIEKLLQPQTHWLDIGCGRQLVPWWMSRQAQIEAELISRAASLTGIDPDVAALRDNRSCQFKLNADSTALPFADGSFDLVTSNMVFEHVENPLASLMEIRRVLRGGGRLLVLTPNWLDIVTIVARAVPNRFHPAIVSRLEKRGAADVYPTHFRFNRPRTIETCLRKAGFKHWHVEPLEHPDAYSHVPVIAQIESTWHQMAARWPGLRGALLIEAEAD